MVENCLGLGRQQRIAGALSERGYGETADEERGAPPARNVNAAGLREASWR